MGGKTTRTSDTKIAEFKINTATYGLPVPFVAGTARISPNVIDWFDFVATPHTDSQRTGKGGGSRTEHTTYTYTAAVLLGLAEGPIGGVGKVWADDKIHNNISKINLTLFNGALGQAPWAYTQSSKPERALPYSGLAYAAGVMDLNSEGGLPQLNLEIKGMLRDTGDGVDVNPADLIAFVCTNPLNGVGFGGGGINAVLLERYKTYCKAANLLITVALTETKKAYEIINEICEATNTIVFWSQNELKLIPRCDERLERDGAIYEPDNIPLYDLDERDFIDAGRAALVEFERADNAEAYNHVPVEFINRANGYEKETVDGEILSDINRRGRRSKSAINIPYLCTKARAQFVADLLVTISLYGRNKYIFKLGWAHCLLEPGDFVTIFDPVIMSKPVPVLIDEVEESEDGDLEVVAIGRRPGANSAPRYAVHEAERPTIDYNVAPGNVNQPVMFEPPGIMENGMVIYIGVSGGPNWGGCTVWVSDDNLSYKQIGVIENPARQGVLASQLYSGDDPDTANELTVNMSMSRLPLNSGTQADADNFNTLCYVGGELISYKTAELIAANRYKLTYLRRGVYGTQIRLHGAGEQFLRVDQSILFSHPITEAQIGKKIYLKFTSWNIFKSAEQSLANVGPFTYYIKGTALTAPLPNVTDLRTYYENGNMFLIWSKVDDFRSPIEYEIRKGPSWVSAEILGRTFNTSFQLQGNGRYWVTAAYKTVHSATPAELLITGARYTQNVLAGYDEEDTGWLGTVSGNAALVIDEIRLINVTDACQGIYQIPEAHKIDIGYPALCHISINYTAYGDSLTVTFDDVESVDDLLSWDGDYNTQVGFRVQIGIDGGEWQNFYAGQYHGQVFDFRVILETYSAEYTAVLNGFAFTIDAPDLIESKKITVPAEGLTVTYDAHFHGVPEPQITIFDAQQDDQVVLTQQVLTGFTVQIKNAGVGVQRDINYLAQKW
jgi:hypothetical protein